MMKKIVLTAINIADTQYEKLRFEAIREKKSIQEIIKDRIFFKPFHEDVENAFSEFMQDEFQEILKD